MLYALQALPHLPQTNPALIGWLERLQSDPLLLSAVEHAANQRMIDLLAGIRAYRSAHYERLQESATEIMRWGSVRLLHLNAHNTPAPKMSMLLIPSLINRYYIMDLYPQRSALQELAAQGVSCYVLDWSIPDEADADKNLEAYLVHHIQPAIALIMQREPDAAHYVAGHCMGGVLAMALAQTMQHPPLNGLILMATPWDFSSQAMQTQAFSAAIRSWLEYLIEASPLFSGDQMLALFYARDPFLLHTKLRKFAHEHDDERCLHFMALESWANDCVDITRGVARDCLIHWASDNQLMLHRWKVQGSILSPPTLTCPTYMIIPRQDKIVPPSSTAPLVELFQECHVHRPDTGHVGMFVGGHAKEQCLRPMVHWMQQMAAKH